MFVLDYPYANPIRGKCAQGPLRGRARPRPQETHVDCSQVIELLKENIPTAAELKRRRLIYEELAEIRSQQPPVKGPFPSAEETIREDRER